MIVPDASVAILLLHGDFTADPRTGAAAELLRGDPNWVVPEHWRTEVLAGTRGLLRGCKIRLSDAEAAVGWLQRVTTLTAATTPHLNRMWQLRSNLNAYDAGYVAVAESYGVTLVTADVRIARAGVARCPVQVVSGP